MINYLLRRIQRDQEWGQREKKGWGWRKSTPICWFAPQIPTIAPTRGWSWEPGNQSWAATWAMRSNWLNHHLLPSESALTRARNGAGTHTQALPYRLWVSQLQMQRLGHLPATLYLWNSDTETMQVQTGCCVDRSMLHPWPLAIITLLHVLHPRA